MIAFFRSLGLAGSLSLIANIALAGLLISAKIDARHWKKQSTRFEELYRGEAKAHAETVANVKIATERARAADRANVERVRAEQSAINERTSNDFEARIRDARARAERLRQQGAAAGADQGGGGSAPVPRLPAPAGQPSQAAGQAGLPPSDGLIATEQAIQLDELIKWIRSQAGIDVNGSR